MFLLTLVFVSPLLLGLLFAFWLIVQKVKSRKVKIGLTVTLCSLFIGTGSYLVYSYYSTPIYTWETNIPARDGNYMTSRLINDGDVFVEIKISEPPTFFLGGAIGRTRDGMRIYELNDDSGRLMLTGFMFPAIFYERQRP